MTQDQQPEVADALNKIETALRFQRNRIEPTGDEGVEYMLALQTIRAHLQQRPLPVRTKFPERYEDLRRHCLRLAHLHESDQSSCSQALRMLGYHGLSLAAVSLLDDLVEGTQLAAPVPDNNYVQPVPDHCDRIVWRNFYYSLPPAPRSPSLPVREEPTDEAEFEIHCNGDYEASACGPRAEAWREIQHYAAQYQQDGPVVIYEVTRTKVSASPSVQNIGEGETGKDGVNPSDGGEA